MSAPTVHRRVVSSVDVPLGPGLGVLRLELDGDLLSLERGHGGGGERFTPTPGARPLQVPADARGLVRDALELLEAEDEA